jgi:hypothetical protein
MIIATCTTISEMGVSKAPDDSKIMFRIPAGMQIDDSEEQPRKADCSIRESLQPLSKVTIESALHP